MDTGDKSIGLRKRSIWRARPQDCRTLRFTCGREGAGARLTSFWAGNSPTTGPGEHIRWKLGQFCSKRKWDSWILIAQFTNTHRIPSLWTGRARTPCVSWGRRPSADPVGAQTDGEKWCMEGTRADPSWKALIWNVFSCTEYDRTDQCPLRGKRQELRPEMYQKREATARL